MSIIILLVAAATVLAVSFGALFFIIEKLAARLDRRGS